MTPSATSSSCDSPFCTLCSTYSRAPFWCLPSRFHPPLESNLFFFYKAVATAPAPTGGAEGIECCKLARRSQQFWRDHRIFLWLKLYFPQSLCRSNSARPQGHMFKDPTSTVWQIHLIKSPLKDPTTLGWGTALGAGSWGRSHVMVWYGYKEGCFDEIDYASKTTGVATSTKLSDFPADAEGNH